PLLPHKHMDGGWTDFRPMTPSLAIQMWNLSQDGADLERALRLMPRAGEASPGIIGYERDHGVSWLRFVRGEADGFPERVLDAALAHVDHQLSRVRDDDSRPEDRYVQHWIDRNPVACG